MDFLRTLLRALFERAPGIAEGRALGRRASRPPRFRDTVDDFSPTRLLERTDEMSDGQAVHVGEGLVVSEEDLDTLPADLQDEFTKQTKPRP